MLSISLNSQADKMGVLSELYTFRRYAAVFPTELLKQGVNKKVSQ